MIFIRELTALFTATEFVIGALMAGWLAWVGIGGMAGGRLVGRSVSGAPRLFERFGVGAALLLPATVAGIRIGRGVLCNPPGNFAPLSLSLLFAILVIAPFGFVYGTLYNLASFLWRDPSGDLRAGISRVYIWEAAGSLAGAVIFSFLLLGLLSQFVAAGVVSAVVMMVILLVRESGAGSGRRVPAVISASALVLLIVFLLDGFTTAMMFEGYRVEKSETSRYAELVAASREGSVTFFSGGSRLFSVPEPERTEETVHIPLLLHPDPESVLLIGGSLGGGWREALKHPAVERIDCIELDGSLVRMSMELGGDLALEGKTVDEGGRARSIDVIEADGRFFLSRGRHAYDVIILSAPPPVNLRWNRYYTREFFTIARGALAENGLFALSHPSSENFLSREQAMVLGTIEKTMRPLFDELLLLPGSTCHFIGGRGPLDPDSLVARIERRGIETRYVSGDFIPFRFSRERLSSLRSDLEGAAGTRENRDLRPSLPYLELLLEGERLGSGAMGVLGLLENAHPFMPTALLAAMLVGAFALSGKRGAPRVAVLSVGLSAFVFQLAVMLSYQAHTGLLYHAIVLLTALFMGGAAAGAAVTARRADPRAGDLRIVHAGFVLLSLLLVARLPAQQPLIDGYAGWFFHMLSALGGFLTGSYYPLVVRTAFRAGDGPPALFYAYDLFGAAVGGMLGGLVIFPMAGVWGVVTLMACIHIGASFLLVGKW